MASSPQAPGAGYEEAAEETLPAPEEAILRMRHAILTGTHWFEALLEAVGRWRVPEERIGDREYRYLIGGEAFDWLLLAERLLARRLPADRVAAALMGCSPDLLTRCGGKAAGVKRYVTKTVLRAEGVRNG